MSIPLINRNFENMLNIIGGSVSIAEARLGERPEIDFEKLIRDNLVTRDEGSDQNTTNDISLLDEDLPPVIIGKPGVIDRLTILDNRKTQEILNFGTLVITSGGIESLEAHRNTLENTDAVNISGATFTEGTSGYVILSRSPSDNPRIIPFTDIDAITLGSDKIKLANVTELRNLYHLNSVNLQGRTATISTSGPYQHYYNGNLDISQQIEDTDLTDSFEEAHLIITSGGIAKRETVYETDGIVTVIDFERNTTGYIEVPINSSEREQAIIPFSDINTLTVTENRNLRLSISDLSILEDETIIGLANLIQSLPSLEIEPKPEPQDLIQLDTQYVSRLVSTPGNSVTGQERLLLEFTVKDGLKPYIEGKDADKVVIRDNQVFLKSGVDTKDFSKIDFQVKVSAEYDEFGIGYDELRSPAFVPIAVDEISVSIVVLPKRVFNALVAQVAYFPDAYLKAHPDVAEAVENGTMPNAVYHYTNFGYFEGRDTGVGFLPPIPSTKLWDPFQEYEFQNLQLGEIASQIVENMNIPLFWLISNGGSKGIVDLTSIIEYGFRNADQKLASQEIDRGVLVLLEDFLDNLKAQVDVLKTVTLEFGQEDFEALTKDVISLFIELGLAVPDIYFTYDVR